MENLEGFNGFLQTVALDMYRDRYKHIRIVEMDLPKDMQAIKILYKVYWEERKFLNYDEFYTRYLKELKKEIETFRQKTTMCKKCYYKGLPARIYRTWAGLITQIHAGYVAESVFGKNSVEMSEELDHQGADIRVNYKKNIINYQVKKTSYSGVKSAKALPRKRLEGEPVDIFYEVPNGDIFKDPKTKKGEFRKPFLRFKEDKRTERFNNGFIVFTKEVFLEKKREIDKKSK